ncbi:MAG: alkane 1-monooxygenase [Bacteroidetes bacterium]|nr:alkane 1-monooxygenase [Bacteroidota bacterium]
MNLKFLKYMSAFISVVVILISITAGGIWVFFAPVYAFVLIPGLELFMQGSEENYTKAEEEVAKKDPKFDILVWLILPVQYIMMWIFLTRVGNEALPMWERGGMILAFGISCGVFGINVAHELGHRSTWYEQLMSKLLLLSSLYMHFFIEHNRGHHKNVSTDEDPASSRRGEMIYAFWFRSVTDGWVSAWHLERDRLAKTNTPWYSFRNEMLVYQLVQIALLAVIAIGFGWKVMLAFIVSSTIGFLLLETVNYIEHYGLRRKKIDGEYYEKVMPVHSWNSNHPVGRLMLFELTRHSDHHYMASRKYQVLRHFDQSPQMPTGYPGMMVLALFPPLWFKVMHAHIDKYKASTEGAALA